MRRSSLMASFLGMVMLLIAGGAQALTIQGAGATFPYPLYSKWFSEYQKLHPDVMINYQPIGSGGGIRQFEAGTIDFGASDAPMTNDQLGKAPEPIIHIPTTAGAVTVTYNVAGVTSNIKLTADVLAGIFLGDIKTWNDARITKLNPGVKFPSDAIMVIHRSEGSGTTNIFTDYLSKVSPTWEKKVGHGTAVRWPMGLGGKGNEGVAGLIKQNPGSIGYVELIYALENKLPFASLKNKRGSFVEPSLASVTAAADGAMKTMPADFRTSIVDAPGANAYPISGFTYLLVHPHMAAPKGPMIQGFLRWALTDGQKYAGPLHYAPLPKALANAALKKVDLVAQPSAPAPKKNARK